MNMSTTRALRISCMLLLTSQVTCDWVEIEQNQYRPNRKSTIIDSNEEPQLEETIKFGAADKKINEDKKWSKGVVDRVTNVGNIKRVQTPSVKTTAVKLDHAGNVFRKNIPDTDEAVHASKYHDRINSPHRHYFTEKPNVINLRSTENNKGIKPIQISLDHAKDTPLDFEQYKVKDISNDNNKLNRNQMKIINEQSLKDDKKIAVHDDYDDHFLIIQMDHTTISPKSNIFHTQSTTKKIKLFHRKQSTEEHKTQNFHHETFQYPNSSITKPSTQTKITKFDIVSEKANNFKILQPNPNILQTETISGKKGEDEELLEEQSKPTDGSNNKSENKMDGMLKLMKVVSDIIYKNTHRSFKGKVMYLEGLKTTLLTTIEGHIDKLWPDDTDRSRQVREARGHLEFPSSESALMTISFLTFAVFLIKLVLQVIHTYKNKTMMVTPTVVAAVGRVAKALRSEQ